MNGSNFDHLTRRLSHVLSRRRVLTAVPAAGVGLFLAGARRPAAASQPVAGVGGGPYLTSAQAEQVGQAPATIRVSWTFGPVIPDQVQILQNTGTPTSSPHFLDIDIDTAAQTPQSGEFQVDPTFLSILVCPRVVENGILLDRIPDEAGEDQYWDLFCIGLPTLSVQAPEPFDPPTQGDLTPTIHPNPDRRKGEFTVSWDAAPEVGFFNVRIVPPLGPEQFELGGGDRSYTQTGVGGGVTYQFSIRGCSGGLLGSSCSDWVTTSIEMTPDLGFDFWRPWFQIHPESFFNQITPVAAVTRHSNNVALFKVGFDGAVWSTYWEPDAEGWRPWGTIFPELVFAQEAPITTVTRSPKHLDLFTTGLNGEIWSAWWDDGGGGWRPWFPIGPGTVFQQDRPVAAVARVSNNITLFRVGFDGAIWSTYWEDDGGGWRGWGTIFPENRFPLEARVTAHSRNANSLEVYVVGNDGAVWSAWWSDDGGGWRRWFSIFPETVFALDQEIVAVSRSPRTVELFTVGLDGAVWTAWWLDDGGGWRPWSQIGPETRFAQNSRITALSRIEGQTDLYITGLDGAVWSTYGTDDGVGWRPWFPIHPETVFDQQHPVAAVSRIQDQVDLYKVGFDGVVWSTFWTPD